jgi:4-carboxymuconolactone decarboxylase
VRQVVIPTVGAVWQAPYELYAHSAVARHAGLDEADVAALAAGRSPEHLNDAETIAHRLALALTTTHRVDDDLYRGAHEKFGTAGVFEITTLTGVYHTVCGILNVFAVPAP